MSEVPFKAGLVYESEAGWPVEVISIDDTLLVKHHLPHGMLMTLRHNLDGTHLDPRRKPHTLTQKQISS